MEVSVWDSYVNRQDGLIMHFDILVDSKLKDETLILNFGNDYLKNKPFKTEVLTTQECRFCHIEKVTQKVALLINTNGYYIIEMENCF